MNTEITSDYIKAVELNRRIITSAQLAQQSLYDMCMGFKEMRDSKLYKELGYSDFREYCEKETGFKRTQVYAYITAVDKLPEEFVRSTEQIGITKLYLLSTLSDEDRISITDNNDLEKTSVRELEEKIKELKSENDKLVDKAYSEQKLAQHMSDKNRELAERICALENEIKELENRPIEVAVADESASEKKLNEVIKSLERENIRQNEALEARYREQTDNLRKKLEGEKLEAVKTAQRDREEQLKALRDELERTKAEYERKLSEQPKAAPANDSKVKFKIYLTAAYDAVKRLCEFASAGGEQTFKDKARELLKNFENELED